MFELFLRYLCSVWEKYDNVIAVELMNEPPIAGLPDICYVLTVWSKILGHTWCFGSTRDRAEDLGALIRCFPSFGGFSGLLKFIPSSSTTDWPHYLIHVSQLLITFQGVCTFFFLFGTDQIQSTCQSLSRDDIWSTSHPCFSDVNTSNA
jgi:hypothetical protein